MKKVFALCLAVVMVLSLVACGGSAKKADSKKWIIASDVFMLNTDVPSTSLGIRSGVNCILVPMHSVHLSP